MPHPHATASVASRETVTDAALVQAARSPGSFSHQACSGQGYMLQRRHNQHIGYPFLNG